jgi:hypothetical protein
VQLSWRNGRRYLRGIVFAAAGFSEVLVLVGLSAVLIAGLSLRLRAA